MSRDIQDIDYERESLAISIGSLMNRLSKLDEERSMVIRRLHKEVNGYRHKETYCLCSWVKKGGRPTLEINIRCPQHGKQKVRLEK